MEVAANWEEKGRKTGKDMKEGALFIHEGTSSMAAEFHHCRYQLRQHHESHIWYT